MKNRKIKIVLSILLFTVIAITCSTHILTNTWLLLTESSNYIPNNSNIITFEPTMIDNGSGGYWRYGEDHKNYYYFSENEENVYYFILKSENCKKIDKFNYETWCNKIRVVHE